MTRSRDLANLGDNSSTLENQGLVFIKTESFSAVSSQLVNNAFSATYDNYIVMLNLTGSTTSQNVSLRMSSGGTTNTAADYRSQSMSANNTTLSGGRDVDTTNWAQVARINNTGQYASKLDFFYPFATKHTQMFADIQIELTGNIHKLLYSFSMDVTTSYDGFEITVAGGTMTGSISIYGYKK